MKCPDCGATIDDEATTCPECGAAIGSAPPSRPRKASPASIVVGVAATVAVLLFVGVIPAIGTAAIALMWIAPNAMTTRLKVIITVILVVAIVALPVTAVLSGAATFTFLG